MFPEFPKFFDIFCFLTVFFSKTSNFIEYFVKLKAHYTVFQKK